jgi:hypothetical protein
MPIIAQKLWKLVKQKCGVLHRLAAAGRGTAGGTDVTCSGSHGLVAAVVTKRRGTILYGCIFLGRWRFFRRLRSCGLGDYR